MNKSTILVVVAMEVEANVLIEKIPNIKKCEKYGYTFYEGNIQNEKIVILLSSVGVINTSSSLTIAITEYNPRAIINYGIAGAMTKNIHTKDIIIGTTISNFNLCFFIYKSKK